jgi:hypothetical protein
LSAPAVGSLRMPGEGKRTITFAYSGDEAGQGWGINPEWGGYRVYEAMRRHAPDFFIHSGDQIYADNPFVAEVKTDDGKVWKNITTEGKSKVAETLDEYRAAFAYNLLDENKRRFAAETAFLVQWDDHEVRNNWYPGQIIGIDAYKVKSASLLSAYARQAMFEYNPMRFDGEDAERVYRRIAYGPALDVLMLDERSYRGPNSPNRQPALDENSAFLGAAQLVWLKRSLLDSKATWKLIASDMPISLVVPDLNPDVPKGTFEAWANADNGPPSGRELEIASLLSFIKDNMIKNVVWVDRRRALRPRDPLCAGARAVHRFRPVLGVCRRSDQRRHLWPQRDGSDLWPGDQIRRRPSRHEAEPLALRRLSVLRHRPDRRRYPSADHVAARSRGETPICGGPRARNLIPKRTDRLYLDRQLRSATNSGFRSSTAASPSTLAVRKLGA